jgi:hypothetical protein
MALIRCKACDAQFSVGLMPNSSCGILLIPAILAAFLSLPIGWHFWSWASLLLPIPTFVGTLILIHFIPWSIEYLLVCWRKCPKCSARKWSYPFTQGFGL